MLVRSYLGAGSLTYIIVPGTLSHGAISPGPTISFFKDLFYFKNCVYVYTYVFVLCAQTCACVCMCACVYICLSAHKRKCLWRSEALTPPGGTHYCELTNMHAGN